MDLGSLKELIHEIRRNIGDRRLILFGSSSLFASFQSHAPEQIGVETTLDADFFLDPDDESCRANLLKEFGRERDYHLTHGFYGDFVDLRLADAFPEGWRDRLVPMPGFENVVALHPMDMAGSKAEPPINSTNFDIAREEDSKPAHRPHILQPFSRTARRSVPAIHSNGPEA